MKNDNPYSAPESRPQYQNAFIHIKAVRRVSKIFRVLGWLSICIYTPIALGALVVMIYLLCFWESPSVTLTPDSQLYRWSSIVFFLAYAGLVYIGWFCVRLGRALLTKDIRAYRGVMFLSFLMLFAFPLTFLGIYNIIMLRKHWAGYEPEQQCRSGNSTDGRGS